MPSIDNIKKVILNIADEFGIKKAILFGSYADGTATENSDIDLLIEFLTPSISLYKLAGIKIKLEETIGKNVDLIHLPIPTNSFIKPNKEVPLYER